MKVFSSIYFLAVLALAVSVSALVLQNFENSNAIVGKQSIEKGPTVETSSGDFSSIQLVDESDAIDIQFTEKLIPNSYIILLKDMIFLIMLLLKFKFNHLQN